MVKSRHHIIAVLDIGTTKIACFIARLDSNSNIEIIGIGHQLSKGFRGGTITDISLAKSALLAAVDSAEKMAGEHVDQVIVNMGGSKLQSHQTTITLSTNGHEISTRDINSAIAQGFEQYNEPGREILHVIPVDYAIDGEWGILNPDGMFAKEFEVKLHIITASETAIQNITQCLAQCHLNIEEIIATPLASSLACLNEDEKSLGTILIDIGGGNCAVSVFKDEHILFTDSIPIGGIHITSDIAQGLSIDITSAERIKTLYGNVIATEVDKNEYIDIPANQDNEAHHISRAELIHIIRPRVEEILELVKERLSHSPIAQTTLQRMVITGGSSQLIGLKELASHIFKKQTRIASPLPVEGMAESTKSPAFSTCAGMLHYAAYKEAEHFYEQSSPTSIKEYYAQIIAWFQKYF